MDVIMADYVILFFLFFFPPKRMTICWQRFGFVNFSELLEIKQNKGKTFSVLKKQ